MGHRVHVLHFKVSGSDRFKEKYPQVRQHDIDAENCFSAKTMEGYAWFKESLYCKFHGLDAAGIGDLRDISGYEAYREVAETFSHRATNIIREHDVEILNLHDYQLFPLLDINQSVGKIFNIHTPILPSYPRQTLEFLRSLASKADQVVVSIPEYHAVLSNDQAGGARLRVTCLPPFIDGTVQQGLFDAAICNATVPDSPFTVASIQRFDAKSGHQQLILGFSRFLAEYPEALLVLVGGPSFTDSIADIRHRYYREAKELTIALGIDKNVFFAGPVPYPCISSIYDKADVFCMLSKSECFGLALTEAMSRKVPAVVTRVGGLRYQIRDGIDGITVEVDDPTAVVAALKLLRGSSNLRARYAESAHRRYLDLFHPTSLMRKYQAVYQSL